MTDGTATGTQLLKDINPGAGGSAVASFTVLGDKAIFRADDGVNGREVWVTDGTAAGTHLLKDINPGLTASLPAEFTVFGGKAYFRATTASNGRELWVTDGTEAGTHEVKDINLGANGSIPDNFTILDDHKIIGTAAKNTLIGTGSFDFIFGLAGNDRLFGLGDDDVLTGGKGRDTMTGGLGHDVFDFNLVTETGKTAATRDVITDFTHKVDHIDIFDIDAKSGTKKNDAFKFIGQADFHHVKGELHFEKFNNPGKAHDFTIVEGDRDGDGNADFQIQLKGLVNLTKADFIL